jgi:hypothetical protein
MDKDYNNSVSRDVIKQFVADFYMRGPVFLKRKIEKQGENFGSIYSILVFEHNVIKRIVLAHIDFFTKMFAVKGSNYFRQVFLIEDSKYDGIFEEIFDLLAISKGGIYEYIDNNEDFILQCIKKDGPNALRLVLGLNKQKYDELWLQILDGLMEKVCENYSDSRTIESGMKFFTLMMNTLREHRSLRSYNKMWEFETVKS